MTDSRQPAPSPLTGRPARDRWLPVLLVMAVLAVAALLYWRLGPAPETEPTAWDDGLTAETVLKVQKDRPAALAEELARLKPFLDSPPCELRSLLGQPPEAVLLPPSVSDPRQPPAGLPPGEAGPADSPPTLAALMESATVMVIARTNEGISTGTGFCVAPGIVATNRHVVGQPSGRIFVTNKALGELCPVELVAVSPAPARDYALLRLAPEQAAGLPVLRLGPGAGRTDRVSAWGFPRAVIEGDPQYKALMEGDSRAVPGVVYSEGSVSTVLDNRPPIIVHTAVISHGNSGGPLVDAEGTVQGINTMISLDDKSYRQMGLSLAGEDLRAFMLENNVPPKD